MPKVGIFLAALTWRVRNITRRTRPTSRRCTAMAATRHFGARLASSISRSTSSETRLMHILALSVSIPTFPKSGSTLEVCMRAAITKLPMPSMPMHELRSSIPIISPSLNDFSFSETPKPMAVNFLLPLVLKTYILLRMRPPLCPRLPYPAPLLYYKQVRNALFSMPILGVPVKSLSRPPLTSATGVQTLPMAPSAVDLPRQLC